MRNECRPLAELSPDEQFLAAMEMREIVIRFDKIIRAMNIPRQEFLTALGLFSGDTRPISENGLSTLTGIPRSSLREHVKEGIDLGFVERSSQGLVHTQSGRVAVMLLLLQMRNVVFLGERFDTHIAKLLSDSQKVSSRKQPFEVESLTSLQFRQVVNL